MTRFCPPKTGKQMLQQKQLPPAWRLASPQETSGRTAVRFTTIISTTAPSTSTSASAANDALNAPDTMVSVNGKRGRKNHAAAARCSALLCVADEPVQLPVAGPLCTHGYGTRCGQLVEAGPVRDIAL